MSYKIYESRVKSNTKFFSMPPRVRHGGGVYASNFYLVGANRTFTLPIMGTTPNGAYWMVVAP